MKTDFETANQGEGMNTDRSIRTGAGTLGIPHIEPTRVEACQRSRKLMAFGVRQHHLAARIA